MRHQGTIRVCLVHINLIVKQILPPRCNPFRPSSFAPLSAAWSSSDYLVCCQILATFGVANDYQHSVLLFLDFGDPNWSCGLQASSPQEFRMSLILIDRHTFSALLGKCRVHLIRPSHFWQLSKLSLTSFLFVSLHPVTVY